MRGLRALVLGFIFALATGFFPTELSNAALAQSNQARARTLFQRALSELDDGRFSEADDLLTQSLAIRESASARFNRALARRGMGKYLGAIEDLERCLELSTRRSMQEQASEMRDELRRALVRVELAVAGGAEQVVVDGESIATSDGEHEILRDPGMIRIEVSREGYAPVIIERDLEPGTQVSLQADVSANPLPARVLVDAQPSSASIEWDGELAGIGSVELSVDAGTYRLRASADDFLPEERDVSLQPGEELQLSLVLAEETGTPLTRTWWFWTAIVAGVAVAGLTAWLIVDARTPDLNEGSFGMITEVLRNDGAIVSW